MSELTPQEKVTLAPLKENGGRMKFRALQRARDDEFEGLRLIAKKFLFFRN